MSRQHFVVLDDGETYSGLDGAMIVGIDDDNAPAWQALDDGDMTALFELADLAVPVPEPPSVPAPSRRRATPRPARGAR